MSKPKYEVCPICGKKGLYSESSGHSYSGKTCRYCKSSWYTSRWNIGTFEKECPFCHCKPTGGMKVVYSHYCPFPKEHIAKAIEREKRKFANKKGQ